MATIRGTLPDFPPLTTQHLPDIPPATWTLNYDARRCGSRHTLPPPARPTRTGVTCMQCSREFQRLRDAHCFQIGSLTQNGDGPAHSTTRSMVRASSGYPDSGGGDARRAYASSSALTKPNCGPYITQRRFPDTVVILLFLQHTAPPPTDQPPTPSCLPSPRLQSTLCPSLVV